MHSGRPNGRPRTALPVAVPCLHFKSPRVASNRPEDLHPRRNAHGHPSKSFHAPPRSGASRTRRLRRSACVRAHGLRQAPPRPLGSPRASHRRSRHGENRAFAGDCTRSVDARVCRIEHRLPEGRERKGLRGSVRSEDPGSGNGVRTFRTPQDYCLSWLYWFERAHKLRKNSSDSVEPIEDSFDVAVTGSLEYDLPELFKALGRAYQGADRKRHGKKTPSRRRTSRRRAPRPFAPWIGTFTRRCSTGRRLRKGRCLK